MNIDDLTLAEIKKIVMISKREKDRKKNKKKKRDIMSDLIGQKVIIRDHMAGLFCTTLMDVDNLQWRGGRSRKIHFWEKAGAVQGVAQTGIDLDKSRITVETPMSCGKSLVEICACPGDIYSKIMGAKAWNPK